MSSDKPLGDKIQDEIRRIRGDSGDEVLHLNESPADPKLNPDTDKDAFSKTRKKYEAHLDRVNAICEAGMSDISGMHKAMQNLNELAQKKKAAPAVHPVKKMIISMVRKLVRFAIADELNWLEEFSSSTTQSLNDVQQSFMKFSALQLELNSELAQYGQSVVPVIDEKLNRVYKETVDFLNNRMDILFEGLDRRSHDLTEWLHNIRKQVETLEHELRRGLALQHRKIEKLTQPDLVPTIDDSPSVIEKSGFGDYDYYLFEADGRGSESTIRKNQKYYIPFFQDRSPVLDIGCGRGEFLELLKEHGIDSVGVDSNGDMIEICRTKGLEIFHADALGYLRSCSNEKFNGVFAAQVVEHLPSAELKSLFTEVYRVLKPGGIFLFETINTASPAAFFANYYRDPTHCRPIHPETYRFFTEISGFEKVTLDYRSNKALSESNFPTLENSGFDPDQWKIIERVFGEIRALSDYLNKPLDIVISGLKPQNKD